MKSLFLIFSFLFLLPTEASAEWKIGTIVIDVVPCPNKGCYISKSCTENPKCEAMKAYKNPAKGKSSEGGANPGSGVCQKSFSGKVNIAVDDEGNQEGFCVFKDQSMLSLSGVWTW